MRALIATSLLLAAATTAPAHAGPQGYGGAYGTTFRCESNGGRLRECATGGDQVQLLRQLSHAPCLQGRTWGYARGGVWVAQGCRAEFRLLGYAGGYGNQDYQGYGNGYSYGNANGYANASNQLIRCESNGGRSRACAMDTRGGVQLVRQLSNAACIEGRNWGSNRGGVWVTEGCRAEFRSGGRNGGYGTGRYGNGGYYGYNNGIGSRVFRCESIGGRTRECAANTRAGVQLVRVLSNAPCIQGRSWGYGRSGIWVSRGCRAEFRAY